MILVTVGTTYYDELVREVDRLVVVGAITEPVFAQIGMGKYEPQHMEWTRYVDRLEPLYREASLVICHGGVGTVFELLALGRPTIAVANRALADDHQADLLRAIAGRGWCTCCFSPTELEAALKTPRPAIPYPDEPVLAGRIWDYLTTPRT